MTTAAPVRQTYAPLASTYRHHPYAPPPSHPRSNGPKWQTPSTQPALPLHQQVNGPVKGKEPPGPPRSRRDKSETPSVGLGVAFGGTGSGKWWDQELPPPPASLSSILDSFRQSGEGDRDLLLSILGAKKAEEERLTALIQTRLTVLQARLSLHSAAAPLSVQIPLTPPSEASPSEFKGSCQPSTAYNHTSNAHIHRGPISPSYMPPPPIPSDRQAGSSGYFHLPLPVNTNRSRSGSGSRSPIQRNGHFPPIRPGGRLIEGDAPNERYTERTRNQEGEKDVTPRGKDRDSASPKSTGSEGSSHSRAPGLELLLDAGMDVERRDSNERDQKIACTGRT